jgi:hypothetical protein
MCEGVLGFHRLEESMLNVAHEIEGGPDEMSLRNTWEILPDQLTT